MATVCDTQKYNVYFLKSAGFSRTSSGETLFSPANASTFLSKSSSARSKGQFSGQSLEREQFKKNLQSFPL